MAHAVLLVDDDVEILDMFRQLLKREPYGIEVAGSPEDALAILAQRRIAVVVSDQRMPGMDGLAFLARVQLEYPETMRMMLTAHGSVDVAMRAINEGRVYRFLLKPVRASELGAALRSALTEWDLRHAHEASRVRERSRDAARAQLERQWASLARIRDDPSGVVASPEDGEGLEGLPHGTPAHLRIRTRR